MSQAVLSVIPGISSWFFLEAKTKKKFTDYNVRKKVKEKKTTTLGGCEFQ